jgi:hypothetical protein
MFVRGCADLAKLARMVGRCAIVALLFVGCLDFDEFSVESTTSSGAGGTGGSAGGAGGVGAGGAPEGGAGTGGLPEVGPCYAGAPISETFDDPMALLAFSTSGVEFTNGQAVLSPTNESGAFLALNLVPGVLSECFFQVELAELANGTASVEWRSLANDNNQLSLVFEFGQPAARMLPLSGSLPLEDATPFLEGFVRVGASGGHYFLSTAPSADGPWSVRFQTSAVTPAPSWLDEDGFLYIAAYTQAATDTMVVDNLNVP